MKKKKILRIVLIVLIVIAAVNFIGAYLMFPKELEIIISIEKHAEPDRLYVMDFTDDY